MDEQLIKMLKYIRLGALLANWDRYLSVAQKGNYSHVRLLKYVIEQEYKIKKETSRKMRLARAKIPEKFVMETFPFNRQPKLKKKESSIFMTPLITCPNAEILSGSVPRAPAKQVLQRPFSPMQLIRDTTAGLLHSLTLWSNFTNQ